MAHVTEPSHLNVLEYADRLRIDASRNFDSSKQVELGQFLTPSNTAQLMASMFRRSTGSIRILDAGAGVGSLTAAVVSNICHRDARPARISVVAYEIDAALIPFLRATLDACRQLCDEVGVAFEAEVLSEDFIQAGVSSIQGSMFARDTGRFDLAIVNPPYRKIRRDSPTRALLRAIGVETSNLYSAFLAVIIRLLNDGGELVMITPRSFCNGPYFRPFRRAFLATMSTQRIHIFDSRKSTFKDDEVLQENVIFHAVKGTLLPAQVTITSSAGSTAAPTTTRSVAYDELVSSTDPDSFIHIAPDEAQARVARRLRLLPTTLATLGLNVSTGRVVDFRARRWLQPDPSPNSAPLIYPAHFRDGGIEWPRPGGRKPNAILVNSETGSLLVPNDHYVLVRRFSAKEERRRIVAATYDPATVKTDRVGFENHLNYFHMNGHGLDPMLAHGLTAFLNSTIVDSFFRQFNGHTQVNASDLRSLRYPTATELQALGTRVYGTDSSQLELDHAVEQEVRLVASGVTHS